MLTEDVMEARLPHRSISIGLKRPVIPILEGPIFQLVRSRPLKQAPEITGEVLS